MPHLLFDTTPYLGQWCVVPLDTTNLEEIRLRTNQCYYLTHGQSELPDGCRTEVSLPELLAFSERAEKTKDCMGAATDVLGVDPPGLAGSCGGAGAKGASLFALLTLALYWHRRLRLLAPLARHAARSSGRG